MAGRYKRTAAQRKAMSECAKKQWAERMAVKPTPLVVDWHANSIFWEKETEKRRFDLILMTKERNDYRSCFWFIAGFLFVALSGLVLKTIGVF